MVAAEKAPLLSAECCTTPDEKGGLYYVDSGRGAAKKDLLVCRLLDFSGLYALSEDVITTREVQVNRAFIAIAANGGPAAVVRNALRN